MTDLTPAARRRIHPMDPAPFPAPGRPQVPLPVPLTSFVGRERQIAVVGDLLRNPGVRLATLTGPGGVGKTRLSIRVAEEVAADFPDGVWFVALAAIRDPALVTGAIAQALGVREFGAGVVDAGLREFLRGRRALLVLDNFEHLLDAGPLVANLLATCVDLTVLVTSREVLRLSGEFVNAVRPLSLPVVGPAFDAAQATACEAVQLFVERAAAGLDGFALTASNAPAVAAICARLDGLPLAIELAATRLRAVPPAALLAHLDRRLPLLHGGARDQPARLRTMRDAIAWSYDLLSPTEQTLFRRLAIFTGGCTLEAAEAVCGPQAEGGEPPRSQKAAGTPSVSVLDGIASLVDKSLVTHTDEPYGEPRWAMLETVREFAAERLIESGEDAPIGARHLAWCLATVEAAWPPRAAAPADDRAMPRLDDERDNLRAGLRQAIATDAADAALRLAGGLAEYWYLRGDFAEGRGWLTEALALPGGDPRQRAAALYGAGILATGQRDWAAATSRAEEGLALAEAHGDRLDELRARWGLAQLANRGGDLARHAAQAEAAVTLAREVGNDGWLGYALLELWEAVAESDPRRASALLEEARRLFAAVGDRWAEMNAVTVLGRQPGDPARAVPLWRRAVELGRAVASPWGVAEGLVGLAAAAAARDARRAARLLGAAEALRAPTGYGYGREILAIRAGAEAAARARLGDTAFAAEWAAGRALPPDVAVAEALAEDAAPGAATADPDGAAALGLTRREAEVLRLLAEGRSDREIAQALFISPKTVGAHIGNVLGKLDLPSRAAAVAYAHKHGLA